MANKHVQLHHLHLQVQLTNAITHMIYSTAFMKWFEIELPLSPAVRVRLSNTGYAVVVH